MRVAIVYDRVVKWGGAERVLLALHEIFPEAPLYTSVYDLKKAPWAKVFSEVKTSFLQKIPFIKSLHELFGWLMPLAFESFDFSEYDLVISVTSEAAKGIITKPETLHICYCLTPTRYLWSHNDLYFHNPIMKLVSKPIVNYLKNWDMVASQRPDEIIAISSEVQERVKKYYYRKSKIIYPPVNLKSQKPLSGKYYLVVARLVKYKKIDLVIKTFNKIGLPLIIVGKGREAFKLKLLARKNIKFAGEVSDEKLFSIYKNAKALIMPQEEDFGIVSIEAQSFGVPVIAYKKGGVQDTVIDSVTGILFDRQSVDSLESAINRFEKNTFIVDNLCTNAKRFSFEVFKKNIVDLISNRSNIQKI